MRCLLCIASRLVIGIKQRRPSTERIGVRIDLCEGAVHGCHGGCGEAPMAHRETGPGRGAGRLLIDESLQRACKRLICKRLCMHSGVRLEHDADVVIKQRQATHRR